MGLKALIYKQLNLDNDRSTNASKQIIISFVLKVISGASKLILVPIALKYLGQTQYGVWFTLSAIIGYVGFIDLGINNGFRNKFAEAVATKNLEKARVYTSTAYAIFLALSVFIFVLFLLIEPLLNWAVILNIRESILPEIAPAIVLVFGFFVLRFFFNLITTMLMADQKPAYYQSVTPIANVISLLVLYLVFRFTESSFTNFVIIMGASPVAVLIVYNVYFFWGKYKKYRPTYKLVKKNYIKALTKLGFKFLVLQLSVLLLFYTDNIILAQVKGPEAVTNFNISYQFFNLSIMFFSVITFTYWSAFTDAFIKKDFNWIKKAHRTLLILWGIFTTGTILMFVISDYFYLIWVGDQVHIDPLLSLFMALFAIFYNFSVIYGSFINGISKNRIFVITYLFAALVNIPLSIFLAKNMDLGAAGIILASSITLIPTLIISPIQYKKIVSGRARGIWDK